MPRALTSPPAGDPSSPTVSVSEALGIPADWTLKDAIAGKSGTEAPAKQADDDPLPGEGEGLENGAPEEGAEGAEGAPAEGAEGAAAEGAEPTGAAKPGAKPGTPVKPAAAKPGAKPTAAAKPAAGKPGTPAKPGAKAAVPAKPGAAAAPKIKVGDKEYTQKELEDLIAKGKTPAAGAEPEAKPGAAVPGAAVEPKKPTPEEIEATRVETRKKDKEWITANAPALGVPDIAEETMDVILGGGKKGIEALHNVIRESQATALLAARKSIYHELGPILEDLRTRQEPLLAAQAKADDEREWVVFSENHPEFVNDRDLVENAAAVLIEKEPERVRAMTMEQFQEEVAKQVGTFKTRFGRQANAGDDEKVMIGDKEFTKAELAEIVGARTPSAGTPAKPAAAAPKPGTPAKPAAPARAKVAPPGSNPPVATPGAGTKGAKGDSDIIASLM